MKTQLTKEQSQRLIELGVPSELMTQLIEHRGLIPIVERTFRLTDLLEILPKEINIKDKTLHLNVQMLNEVCSVYYEYFTRGGCRAFYESEELIDALYELTVWCLETGHLKFE